MGKRVVEILSVLSLAVSIIPTLEEKINDYLKGKQVKKELFEALEIRIKSYMESYEKLVGIPQEMLPYLDQLENRYATPNDVNDLRKISTDLAYAYADWIESFIALSKSVKTLKENNPAFMNELKTYDSFVYDFIFQIAAMTKANRLVVNENLYLFAGLHKKKLKKLYQGNQETCLSVDEASRDIKIVKEKLAPMRNTPISEDIQAQYLDAIKQLRKANQRVSISKELAVNMQDYILPTLKPLIQILNEISFAERK